MALVHAHWCHCQDVWRCCLDWDLPTGIHLVSHHFKVFVVVGSFVCFVLLHIDDQGSICDRPSPDARRLVVNWSGLFQHCGIHSSLTVAQLACSLWYLLLKLHCCHFQRKKVQGYSVSVQWKYLQIIFLEATTAPQTRDRPQEVEANLSSSVTPKALQHRQHVEGERWFWKSRLYLI